ncbi:MAG: PLDc N-terminal domain-containing protein [Natronomonas sp.]
MIETIPLQGLGGPDLSIPFLWVIFLLVAIWTYFDAEKNSSHPSFLWALVVFIAPILGIILYFIFGRN